MAVRELICIVCPKGCHLAVDIETGAVTGNLCSRGEAYGKNEILNPVRVITSTVKIEGAEYRRCPVKLDKPISKKLIFEAMDLLNNIVLHSPVFINDKVIESVCGTDSNFIVTRDL